MDWVLLIPPFTDVGLIRGVKGVIIGQLLIGVMAIGYVFELYSRNFLVPEFWALIIVLFALPSPRRTSHIALAAHVVGIAHIQME